MRNRHCFQFFWFFKAH